MNQSNLPEIEKKFKTRNNKKYKFKSIINNAVYDKEQENKLPGLYCLVLSKGYPKKESTWEPSIAIMHLCILINPLHKNYLKKPTANLLPLNSTLLMAKPIAPKKPK